MLKVLILALLLSANWSQANECLGDNGKLAEQNCIVDSGAAILTYKGPDIRLRANEGLLFSSTANLNAKIQLNSVFEAGDYVFQIGTLLAQANDNRKFFSNGRLGSRENLCLLINSAERENLEIDLSRDQSLPVLVSANSQSSDPYRLFNTRLWAKSDGGVQIFCFTDRSPRDLSLEDLRKMLPNFSMSASEDYGN